MADWYQGYSDDERENTSQVVDEEDCAPVIEDIDRSQFPKKIMKTTSLHLIYRSSSILEFTDNLATSLNCRRVVVECSSVDETSTAVVAVACESLGHVPVIFSRYDSTKMSETRASTKPASSSDNTALRSFHYCLRTCIRNLTHCSVSLLFCGFLAS
jgi:hypothetical protein